MGDAGNIDCLFVYGTLLPTARSLLGSVERRRLSSEGTWLGDARVAGRLFDLGADLATPSPDHSPASRLNKGHVSELESQIDAASDQLEPLRNFILPGGTVLAARLHIARTVCRRAERQVVELAEHEALDPLATVYLNRLADLLFAQARLANAKAGVADVPWLPERGS